MPLTTAEYSRRWRESHPEQNKDVHKNYYNRNKEQTYTRVVRFRLFKSECKRLMNININ
jgi:hypothetical protein